MHVLRIDSGKAYFIISEVKIKPEKLSRDNLLQILNNVYETNKQVTIPDKSELDTIKNSVEKEIVQQIMQKISDFSNNVENIRREVQMQFPDMDL